MSWETKKLGEVCKIFSGNSINAKIKESLYTNVAEGTPYIATKDISYNGEINYLNGISIPERDKNKFRKAKSNCVFICAEGGSAGRKIAFSERECFFVNKLFCLEAKLNVLPKYVYYFLMSEFFQNQFKNALTGLIGGVSLSKIKLFEISYPPLAMQKQIVKKLDTAFADIDKAIEASEKKIFNLKKLFEAYIQRAFEKQKSRFGIVKLVNVCDLCNGFAFKSSKFVNDGTPILRISNIQNGEISTDKSVYANQSDYKEDLGRYWVNDGDLLLAMSGATTGKVGINKTGLGFYLNQRVGLLRPKENLLTEYLFYFLSTKVEQNLSISAGAAQPNLSSKQIYEIEIPAVDIETQKSFLRVVEELFNQTSSLERLYSKKLDNLNALKSAILKQAFAGELIKDAA